MCGPSSLAWLVAGVALLLPERSAMRPEVKILAEIATKASQLDRSSSQNATIAPRPRLEQVPQSQPNRSLSASHAALIQEVPVEVAGDTDIEDLQKVFGAELNKAIAVGIEEQGWSLFNIAVAIVLCGAWSFFPCFLALARVPEGIVESLDPNVVSTIGSYPPAQDCVSALKSGDESDGLSWLNTSAAVAPMLRRILAGEVFIAAIQPFLVASLLGLAALVFGWEYAAAPPVWVMIALLVLPIVRVIRVETMLAGCSVLDLIWQDLTELTMPPCNFMASKYEVLDATLDGMTIVSIFVLETHNPLFKDRSGAALAAVPLGWVLAPLSATIGLSGMLFIMQVIAAVMQVASVLMRLRKDIYVAAQIAGFGGLADRLRESEEVDDEDTELQYISQTVYEALPQMFIQVVAIIASGTGLLELPVLLASVISSVGLLFWRSFVLMQIGVCGCRLPALMGGLLMFALSAWMCVWLFMSEGCETLLFDMRDKTCVHDAPMNVTVEG